MDRSGLQAVVLGAGLAGLLAARVLSEFYESVTVVERDTLADHAAQRRGVPQGRALHSSLSRATQVLDELFPGLLDELVTAGAVVNDDGDFSRMLARIGRYELNRTGKLADPAALTVYQASRPFLEFHLRRHVAALDNVTVIDGCESIEPIMARDAVTGVRIINRETRRVTALNADLVVDAMGQATRTPVILERNGFGRPPESRIASTWGYCSQLLRIPAGRLTERMVYIFQERRRPGGILLAYEDDTWMLGIARSGESGVLPGDFAEMLVAAEQVFPAEVMAGLRYATPLGDIATSRNNASLWRRYDQMSHLPAGLVVLGDALCRLNPYFGQGFTMAAVQAMTLRTCLQSGQPGLAQRFYREAAEHIEPVWAMNAANDAAPAARTRRSVRQRLEAWTRKAALQAAVHDITVAERLARVRNLVDPATRLRDPALLSRILFTKLRYAGS